VILFRLLLRVVLSPILYACWRPKNSGMKHVPSKGAALLASNHQSIFDHFLTVLPLRRWIFFIAKAEYVTTKGPKGRLKQGFFQGVGVVPVDRAGGDKATAAIDTGLRILGEGKLLGIYPEGTRAPDSKLYKGKTGVARLALQARVPVIPVAMVNTFDILPEGKSLPRLGKRPEVKFGEPLDFSRYYGQADDPAVRRAVTDEIMQAIQKLSGQEYVDSYASDAKREAREAHKARLAAAA
jgi:1-acyl-sn-glycerol-3-phosphate acyltransferase